MSMGNGGLQLLQAAAAQFCCIRLPILRQFLSAHRLRSWRQRSEVEHRETPCPTPLQADHTYQEAFQVLGLVRKLLGMGWWPQSWGCW